jgi:hypothetical protein
VIASRWMAHVAFLFSSIACFAQAPPASDPTALRMANQSLAALTGGVSVADVTLNANASWIAGSDNRTGTAILKAKGLFESRVDLAFTDGMRSDVRNSAPGYAQGAWIGTDGVSHAYAGHNCFTDAAWFMPALSSLSMAGSSAVASYVGEETRFGLSVQHISVFRPDASNPLSQDLSTTDFYLDSSSFLPVSVSYDVHPDDDLGTNIPVDVKFSDYQAMNNILVPTHVQQYLQGTLHLDIAITNVVVNSGLADTIFDIQ